MTASNIPSLPTEILEKIVFHACDLNVTETLKSHITNYAFKKAYPKKILIQGDVQSGKTGEIIKILKKDIFKPDLKVLVIQNSLLVLKQYESRLKSEGIDFQVVDVNTKKIVSNVILLINNVYRYTYFYNLTRNKTVDILILDESDITILGCPLVGKIEYHVTATPIYHKKLDIKFDHCIKLEPPKNYYGLNHLNIVYQSENDNYKYINSFLETDTGIMLINKFVYIQEMVVLGNRLSNKYPTIPIVLLNSEKTLLINGISKKLKFGSISKIIDYLNEYPHIIFIANRLSLRGLSYVSSDHMRHLTHQITKVKYSFTNFMQSLRICGVYNIKNDLELKLIIDSEDERLLRKHQKKYDQLQKLELS